MGPLDEAIREHLELKRKQGISEQDLKQQEEEALGRGRPPVPAPEAGDEPAPAETPESARAALAEPDEHVLEPDDQGDPPPVADVAEEIEPDEVLPDESLEPSTAHQDVLEETPEFFEETPEQDHLWFEQRPPKDFDFGD